MALIVDFVKEGAFGLGQADAWLSSLFEELLSVLNGFWWDPFLTQFCDGVGCCRRGYVNTFQKVANIVLRCVFRERPTIPKQAASIAVRRVF